MVWYALPQPRADPSSPEQTRADPSRDSALGRRTPQRHSFLLIANAGRKLSGRASLPSLAWEERASVIVTQQSSVAEFE